MAWGARVRQSEYDNWRTKHEDADWWVHTLDAEIRDVEQPPEIGETYSEWHLLPEDFGAVQDDTPMPDEITEKLVQETLAERRNREIPSTLSIQPTGYEHRQRDLALDTMDAETVVDDLAEEFNLPQPCRNWVDMKRPKREKMVEGLRAVAESDIRARKDLRDDEILSYAASTWGNYIGDDTCLGKLIEKTSGRGRYEITPMGEQALAVDWEAFENHLRDD